MRFKCNCGEMLNVTVIVPSIRCGYCKRDYMWWNNEYREYEVAEIVDEFSVGYEECSGIGMINKIRYMRRNR